jgi:OmpA-OmpF porin, OOP family
MYFFVQNHPENSLGVDGTQDIWMSKKDEQGVWSAPKHMSGSFNQNKLNQVFTVFSDGSLLVRGTRSRNEIGFSLVGAGGAWQELNIQDFQKMCKGRFWGASMSVDKKHLLLYFSEVQDSKISDLYSSHVQPNGAWSRPAKMALSTTANDFGPFISPDQKTMFFASDRQAAGRQGLVDIYRVTRTDDTWNNWSAPVNVGKPLNTAAEDDYFSMDEAGNVYVARSNRLIDVGQLDIFVLVPKDVHLNLNGVVYDNESKQIMTNVPVTVTIKEIKPVSLKSDAAGKFATRLPETQGYAIQATAPGYKPFNGDFKLPKINSDTTVTVEVFLDPIPKAKPLVIAGTVKNKKTGELLEARVAIMRKSDGQQMTITASDGEFTQQVPSTGWYMFTASREGFLTTTDSLNYADASVTPMSKTLLMQPIEVGITVRLKNIYFDFNKATLKPESFVELNKVVALLKENPTVEIEIEGHTDSVGPDDRNQLLSQNRSQSVVDYIVSQGIDAGRLQARGFGESKPIDTNDTDAGRANNRRVEFTVVKT